MAHTMRYFCQRPAFRSSVSNRPVLEKSILRRSGLVLWVATTLACATPCVGQAVDPTDGSPTQAQQPDAPELATESPFVIQADPARRSGGRPLIVIDESEWITQVIDHRTASHILGQREVKTADGARDLIPFYGDYSDKLASRTIPVPPTFTNVQMFALSDTGRVVGFASRPMGTSNRNLQGIVWEAVNDQIHLLDPPTTYHGSCAYDISADGRRVSLSVANPNTTGIDHDDRPVATRTGCRTCGQFGQYQQPGPIGGKNQ